MPDNKRQALYDQAKSSGMSMPDFTTFDSLMNDSPGRKKFYDAAGQNKIPMPDYSTYESLIGEQKQTQSNIQSTIQDIAKIKFGALPAASQAIEQARRGNWMGGGLGIGNAILQNAFSDLAVADYGLRKIPYVGEPISDIINAPLKAMGWVGEKVLSPVASMIPTNWTGRTPQQQQYTGEQAQQTAQTLGQVGTSYALKGIKAGMGKVIPENLPARLISKAGKFSGTPEQVIKKGEIALREKINPSNYSALEKLNNTVDNLDSKIGEITKSTDVIQTDNMLRYVSELQDKVKSRELTPEASLSEITKVIEATYEQRGESIPADLAHSIKKGIYAKDKAAYQQQFLTGKTPAIDIQTEMKIAKGILGEFKQLYPEAEKLLSREADLMSIKKDIQRSVRRELVKSNFSNTLLMALSPKWWLMKAIANSKQLEYGLGRLLYRAQNKQPSFSPMDFSKQPPPFIRPSPPDMSKVNQ